MSTSIKLHVTITLYWIYRKMLYSLIRTSQLKNDLPSKLEAGGNKVQIPQKQNGEILDHAVIHWIAIYSR